jgi:hypothetical protein
MLQVSRGELLEAKGAIDALGKVYLPVSKEKYWFVKTLDKILRALKYEGKGSQRESNRLVQEFGTEQPGGGKGIKQTDFETMGKYQEAMDAYMEVPVEINIKALTLEKLAEAQVTLQATDQVALMWLIQEED